MDRTETRMLVPIGARSAAYASLVALIACSNTFGARVHETVHQTVATGASPTVRVENVAGEVRIAGWEKPTVDVDATKYGYNTQELRDVTVSVNREDGGVSIVTGYARPARGGGVRYRIFVPVGASLQVRNIAGLVSLAGIGGNLDVETQAGTINVDAGRVAEDRSIVLHATTGAVSLAIARGSSARIEAVSTVGGFSSDIPGVSQSRENIVGVRGGGTIGTGSALIRLTTTTGGIALKER